jgi:hypothetical protein
MTQAKRWALCGRLSASSSTNIQKVGYNRKNEQQILLISNKMNVMIYLKNKLFFRLRLVLLSCSLMGSRCDGILVD